MQLAWAVANAEANMAGDQRIRPQHLLLGVLKVIDADFIGSVRLPEVSAAERESLPRIAAEVCQYLEMGQEQVKAMRRRMRREVRGSAKPNDENALLHRSDETRAVFEKASEAAAGANAPAISLAHLAEALFAGGHVSIDGGFCRVSAAPVRKSVREAPRADGWPGRNLSVLATSGDLAPFVGRQQELGAVLRALSRTKRRNVAVVGKAGVGKTALIHGLARALKQKKGVPALSDHALLELCGSEVGADAESEAQLSRRVRRIFAALSSMGPAILFIEDFGGLVPCHLKGSAALTLIKRELETGDVPCVVAATGEHWSRVTKNEPSLKALFQVVELANPPAAELRQIADAWAQHIGELQHVHFSTDAVESAVAAAAELPSERALPDRLVDILENAATVVRVAAMSSQSAKTEVTAAEVRTVLREHTLVHFKEPPRSISERNG